MSGMLSHFVSLAGKTIATTCMNFIYPEYYFAKDKVYIVVDGKVIECKMDMKYEIKQCILKDCNLMESVIL